MLEARSLVRRLQLLGLALERGGARARALELGLRRARALAPRRLRLLDQLEPHRLEVAGRHRLRLQLLELATLGLELGAPPRAQRVVLALHLRALRLEPRAVPPRRVALLLQAQRLDRERLHLSTEAVSLLGHVVEHGAQRVHLLLEGDVAHEQLLDREVWHFDAQHPPAAALALRLNGEEPRLPSFIRCLPFRFAAYVKPQGTGAQLYRTAAGKSGNGFFTRLVDYLPFAARNSYVTTRVKF